LNLEAKQIRLGYSFFPGVIDVEHRLLELVGKFQSQLGSTAEHALKTENQGAIAFLDVSPGSRRIRAGCEFNQIVSVIDSPILGLPAFGNISPMFKACLDCEIQSGSIGAGLSAGYNFCTILSCSSLSAFSAKSNIMPLKELRKKLVLSSFSKSQKRSPRLGIGGIDLGFELVAPVTSNVPLNMFFIRAPLGWLLSNSPLYLRNPPGRPENRLEAYSTICALPGDRKTG
jgi:hypothetical protein